MKVLFLPAWYPAKEDPLPGTFIREHAKAASLYHEIVVLCVQRRLAGGRGSWDPVEERDGCIRTVRVGVPSCSNRAIDRVSRLAACILGVRGLVASGWKPDLIHAHIYAAGLPALVLGKRYGTPVVVSEHWTWFIRRRLSVGRRVVARWVLNRADLVVAVSEHLKEAIRGYGVTNDIEVIPNAVDTATFRPVKACPPEKRKDKRILFVGRLVPQKRVDVVIRSLEMLYQSRTDFTLDIGGDGPLRGELAGLAEDLGVSGLVRFKGSLSKAEVAQAIQGCDVFVQPSQFETFGIAPLEALACGKPVIVSDIPGPRELIRPDMGLLVSPGDVGAFAEAINFMLDNYSRYLPDVLANYVQANFSHEAVGRRLDEIYRRVCIEAGT